MTLSMGWYDGNPSSLNNLPQERVAKKYIDFMGGEEAIIAKAKKSFDKGGYRLVAEVMKHAVFANPKKTVQPKIYLSTHLSS